MALEWKAMERKTDCWIHHEAYVLNRKPRAGSYLPECVGGWLGGVCVCVCVIEDGLDWAGPG